MATIERATDPDGLIAFWPQARGTISLTSWAYRFIVAAEKTGEPIDKKLKDRLANVLRLALRSDYSRLLNGEEVRERVEKLALPKDVYLSYAGQAEEERAGQIRLATLTAISTILITMVLALAFRRRGLAALVLVNLPFCLIGSMAAIVASGIGLTLGSLVGLVTVFGIGARNSAISAPVKTASTPSIAFAALVSMERMRPCATSLRLNARCCMPTSAMSST